MAGTYKGTYHGGNDFAGQQSFGDIFAVHQVLKQAAAANQAAAGVNAGTSFLTYHYSETPAGPSPVVGPGAERVMAMPVTAPGLLEFGDLPPRPSSWGPGTGVVGEKAGGGPGNRVLSTGPRVTKGPGANPGLVYLGPPDDLTYSWEVGKSNRTPLMISGRPLAIDTGWSDAGDVEERWGEGDMFGPSTLYNWAVFAADLSHDAYKRIEDEVKSDVPSSHFFTRMLQGQR